MGTVDLVKINDIYIRPGKINCIIPQKNGTTFIGIDGVCDEYNNKFVYVEATEKEVLQTLQGNSGQSLNILG